MPAISVRARRASLVVLLLAASVLVALPRHASATINPDDVDRPKISAGDWKFGNKGVLDVLDGGVVNWDESTPADRAPCPVYTPWISGILYLNNLDGVSTRVEVLYHDNAHIELHSWHSATFTPTDNKTHEHVISDNYWGSSDLDHIVIIIEKKLSDGSWASVGATTEYRPWCQTDG